MKVDSTVGFVAIIVVVVGEYNMPDWPVCRALSDGHKFCNAEEGHQEKHITVSQNDFEMRQTFKKKLFNCSLSYILWIVFFGAETHEMCRLTGVLKLSSG